MPLFDMFIIWDDACRQREPGPCRSNTSGSSRGRRTAIGRVLGTLAKRHAAAPSKKARGGTVVRRALDHDRPRAHRASRAHIADAREMLRINTLRQSELPIALR
jgi:hypothetical protein